jgi:hypothetical protein
MKKLIVLILSVVIGCNLLVATTFAQGFDDLPADGEGAAVAEGDKDGFLNDSTVEVLEQFQEQSGFRSFSGQSNRNAVNEAGIDSLTGIIYTIIDIVKYAVGAVAVFIITISIIQMITAGADKSEEEYGKVKDQLLYAVVAVVIIISLDFFFNNVFDIGRNNFLESEAIAKQFALAGAGEIRGIYNLIQAALATIAVLMLVYAGFRVVANAGDEEQLTNLKKQVIWASAGLLLVAVSEFVVKDIFFVNGGQTFSVENGRQLLVSFTNFISGFIAFASFLSFIYGGYLYVTSGTLEDKSEDVKRIFIGGIIGILIAAGAFGIVNTFVQLDSSDSPEIIQNQLDRLP